MNNITLDDIANINVSISNIKDILERKNEDTFEEIYKKVKTPLVGIACLQDTCTNLEKNVVNAKKLASETKKLMEELKDFLERVNSETQEVEW